MSVDTYFCKTLLQMMQRDVTKLGIKVDGKPLNLFSGHGAWTYKLGKRDYEFHGPKDYYWANKGANAYDARYHGWTGYLRMHQPDDYARLEALGTTEET